MLNVSFVYIFVHKLILFRAIPLKGNANFYPRLFSFYPRLFLTPELLQGQVFEVFSGLNLLRWKLRVEWPVRNIVIFLGLPRLSLGITVAKLSLHTLKSHNNE